MESQDGVFAHHSDTHEALRSRREESIRVRAGNDRGETAQEQSFAVLRILHMLKGLDVLFVGRGILRGCHRALDRVVTTARPPRPGWQTSPLLDRQCI